MNSQYDKRSLQFTLTETLISPPKGECGRWKEGRLWQNKFKSMEERFNLPCLTHCLGLATMWWNHYLRSLRYSEGEGT